MNKETLEALNEVVEYITEYEEAHFNECEKDDKENHIYNSVLILKKYYEDKNIEDGEQ